MRIASLKDRTIAYLSRHSRSSLTLKELARHLKVRGKEEYRALADAVEELVRAGAASRGSGGKVRYVRARVAGRKGQLPPRRLTGELSVTKRAYGFVRVEGIDEDIFIPPKYLHTAIHGDTVAVVQFPSPEHGRRGKGDHRREGEIVEILRRPLTNLVGTLQKGDRFSFVVPDDEHIPRDIYVAGEEAGGARHGDKVVVRLHPWEDEHLNPEGTIVEVLGPAGDARVEVVSVARSFGLPMGFPQAVEEEARRLPSEIPAEEARAREDFRSVPCVTIDPEDAKDFDDAVSCEVLSDGTLRVGVHIADVSHYVRQGSALDAEARARGTSVYLVNEVVPMLPERLSNDLCSLRPGVDRLTYSVIMDVTPQGTVLTYRIAKSIIHSAKRFTYEEVQRILDARKGDHADVLRPLYELSKTLLRKRRQKGSLDFDTGEAKFTFDARGLPVSIVKKSRLGAHRLVEECMLLANRIVAEDVGRVRKGEELPFIYRVHDVPDPSRIQDLANFVKQFGYSLPVTGGVTSKSLQKLLDDVEGSEVENLINEVALRAMAKAVYAVKNIGHYGLAFRYYTHFTSPIRRYPDLVVHRLLETYARGVAPARRTELASSLEDIARLSSERERVAQEAERTSVRVMQVEYMKRHLSEEFEAVISGVTQYGIFVEVKDLLVEGLVRVRDLTDDYYLYDEKRYQLRGRSSGRVLRLGDRVRVRVVSVDPEEHEIDFMLVG